ncbi:dynein heavy chain [Culex quinquefasciatus]|uniref:Dynein heavy chain n=1 Tax=Culex quinquefasciatus TaxID=7176 RepID=B0W0Y8_CULQU|nr:dynein heavy chain, cytoplasmic [Culex quinquefasciatus]EDS42805.1 dynein heavy chain [Culex quinquefasciatus]|eukprot:XP_001842372.1 dynein heavy chain [Culex quinquefasciatus]
MKDLEDESRKVCAEKFLVRGEEPPQGGAWVEKPDMDSYGTQRVISFLHQLVEHKGFYRAGDQSRV